jgi:hypothetical protein
MTLLLLTVSFVLVITIIRSKLVSVGAILFMLEHRFYGSSIPDNDLSVENMKYLSADQVRIK